MSLGNAELRDRFSTLTTPLVADACLREHLASLGAAVEV